jgi:hypothetical protein
MDQNKFRMMFGMMLVATSCLLVFSYSGSHAISAVSASVFSQPELAMSSAGPQQFPIMDKIADKLIGKYQTATCEQLWQERSLKGQPKSQEKQEAIQMLRDNPQMRDAFLSKVAAPIANKMFECGMIP